jgi:hypothetical protein
LGLNSKPLSSSYQIEGLGRVALHEDPEPELEPFQKNALKRSVSKAKTCESTPEQNRGFAQIVNFEEEDSSEV